MDGQPVLALTGMPFHDLIGTYTQQDVEIDKVFADVAAYNMRIMGPTHVESVTDLACRTAISRRTVAHITFPVDLQDKPVSHDQQPGASEAVRAVFDVKSVDCKADQHEPDDCGSGGHPPEQVGDPLGVGAGRIEGRAGFVASAE